MYMYICAHSVLRQLGIMYMKPAKNGKEHSNEKQKKHPQICSLTLSSHLGLVKSRCP